MLIEDSVGEHLPGTYDISTYRLDAYDTPSDGRYMLLTVNMVGGLPALIQLDLDLDDDTTTGTTASMVALGNVFPTCVNPNDGGVCVSPVSLKPEVPGPDIYFTIYLRKQANDSTTALCDGCMGPGGTCMYKEGTPCTGIDCNQGIGTCVKASGNCDSGDANCYLIPGDNAACRDCSDDGCYEMTIPCGLNEYCGKGRLLGEYHVSDYRDERNDAGNAPYRGRVEMPLPPELDSTETLNIFLPLDPAIDAIIADGEPGGAIASPARHYNFDTLAARDTVKLRYQVSAWRNSEEYLNAGCASPPCPDSANDYISPQTASCSPLTSLCVNALDVAPDVGMSAANDATTLMTGCFSDSNINGSVKPDDGNAIATWFLHGTYPGQPCPGVRVR